MKKSLIIVFLLTITSFQLFAQSSSHRIIQPDKVKHFAAGSLISGSVQMTIYGITDDRNKAMWFGIAVGVGAGVGKEIYDMASGQGMPSFKDVLWTGIGAVATSLTLRYTIKIKRKRNEKHAITIL